MVDGNDIWEALFGIMRGNVPDEMTEEVCSQLAAALTTPAPEKPDALEERDVEFVASVLWAHAQRKLGVLTESSLPRTRSDYRKLASDLMSHPALAARAALQGDGA